MLFHLASLIRYYVNRATTWLLVTTFAIDQLTDTLLEHARRHYWHPVVMMSYKVRKGRLHLTNLKNVK